MSQVLVAHDAVLLTQNVVSFLVPFLVALRILNIKIAIFALVKKVSFFVSYRFYFDIFVNREIKLDNQQKRTILLSSISQPGILKKYVVTMRKRVYGY